MPTHLIAVEDKVHVLAYNESVITLAVPSEATPVLAMRWLHKLGDGDEWATGTDDAEMIEGGGGDDSIFGMGGDDILSGDAGDDLLGGGDGRDELRGGIGNDVLNGGSAQDALIGGAGDDTYVITDLDIVGYDPSTEFGLIYGSKDTIFELANEGYDKVITNLRTFALGNEIEALVADGSVEGGVLFIGNLLDNDLFGSDFADKLIGGGGNDVLDGDGGEDTLTGGAGDDVYWVSDQGDVIVEGAGFGKDAVWTTLDSYTLGANVETLTYVGQPLGLVFGFEGTGNSLANTIIGAAADDTLSGAAGDDLLNGGAGNDQLLGGAGNDLLVGGTGADTMKGQAGNDSYKVDSLSDVVVEATGNGIDTVYTTLLSFTLGKNVENLTADTGFAFTGTGNELENTITGNKDQDKLFGLAGDDILQGLDGKDTLDGGEGEDILYGGAGNDVYVVDNEQDLPFEWANAGTDTVQAKTKAWTLLSNLENLEFVTGGFHSGTGNTLANVMTGNSGVDHLHGLDGNDWLNGNAGLDELFGGKNDDTLYGGEDGDRLYGEDGSDWMSGGGGADLLVGGAGADVLYGGLDNDVFRFDAISDSTGATADRIRDFGYGNDVIALDGIDAATTLAGNQAFAFLGTAGFTGAAGQLRYSVSGNVTSVYGDVNGDKAADLVIHIDGQHALGVGDFFF